jgi:hypothetical protein
MPICERINNNVCTASDKKRNNMWIWIKNAAMEEEARREGKVCCPYCEFDNARGCEAIRESIKWSGSRAATCYSFEASLSEFPHHSFIFSLSLTPFQENRFRSVSIQRSFSLPHYNSLSHACLLLLMPIYLVPLTLLLRMNIDEVFSSCHMLYTAPNPLTLDAKKMVYNYDKWIFWPGEQQLASYGQWIRQTGPFWANFSNPPAISWKLAMRKKSRFRTLATNR